MADADVQRLLEEIRTLKQGDQKLLLMLLLADTCPECNGEGEFVPPPSSSTIRPVNSNTKPSKVGCTACKTKGSTPNSLGSFAYYFLSQLSTFPKSK